MCSNVLRGANGYDRIGRNDASLVIKEMLACMLLLQSWF